MAIFLNWKQQEPRSRERLITDLFSYLSPRWYPVNVIGTDVYYTFKMYADQLSSASLESKQVFEDLFIDTVRSTPAPGYSYSKMYDNFGRNFEVDKLFNQDYEIYGTSSLLQSYRQQIRFLYEAFFNSTTIESIERIGQSYTGVSPVIRESSKDTLGWRLQTVTGSILSVGNNLVVLSNPIPPIGNIYNTDTSLITQGELFLYTFSRLGVNTILLSSKEYYSEVDCYIFASGSGSTSFQNSIENSIDNVLKADIIPRYSYSDKFSTWKPSTASLPVNLQALFMLASGGFMYNSQPIISTNEIYYDTIYGLNTPFYKYSLVSDVVSLPVDYINYNWYYDWSILNRNDTTYKVYLRSYSLSLIPETVYFKEYKDELEQPLLLSQITPSGSLKEIGHWVFTSPERGNDVTENMNDLIQASGAITTEFIDSREQTKIGWRLKSGITNLLKTTYSGSLNLYDTDFLWEGWLYGIDNEFNSGDFWTFKREIPSTGSIYETSVSGSIISFSSASVFNNATTAFISSLLLDSTHLVINYTDVGNSSCGTSIMGVISGSTITFGSEYVFNNATTSYVSSSKLDSTHFVVSYKDEGNSNYGTSIVGTVSGSLITFGSESVFNTSLTQYTSTFNINSSNFVNCYGAGPSGYGTSIIGTVSGSVITFGSSSVFRNAGAQSISAALLDSTHFITGYRDAGNAYRGASQIGVVSGTNITFGSASLLDSSASSEISVSALDSTHFVISFQDEGNNFSGTSMVGVVSGSTISLGSKNTFSSTGSLYISSAALNASKVVTSYSDQSNSYKGTSITGNVSGSVILYDASSKFTFSNTLVQYIKTDTLDTTHYAINFAGNTNAGTTLLGTVTDVIIVTPGNTGSIVPIFQKSLVKDGYAIVIDSSDYSFGFQTKNGLLTGSIKGSILDYLLEEPYRAHYFACLNISDYIRLYVDNNIVASGTLTTPIPLVTSGSIEIQSNAINSGMDEIYLSTGSISPDYIKLRFQESSPKIYSQYIFDPYKYHQMEVQVFSEGSKEFELHQFSLRGINPDVLYSPLFLASSSLPGI